MGRSFCNVVGDVVCFSEWPTSFELVHLFLGVNSRQTLDILLLTWCSMLLVSTEHVELGVNMIFDCT